jgi:hypothetical protein
MLAKFVIALAAFLFGTAATTIVASARAKNFRRIASREGTQAELRGFDRGWQAASNSGWLWAKHIAEYKKNLEEAENQS